MSKDDLNPRATRYAVWFPMRIEAEGDVILSITRDVSESGVLVVAAAELELGSNVAVTLAVPGDEENERVVQGTIVRVEANDADSDGIWRHKVAVSFDETVDQLEDVLQELERTSQVPSAP